MAWTKYFQIITIILLVFMGVYFITPKYSFNANGRIRENKFNGKVERLNLYKNKWVPVAYDGLDLTPVE